MSFFSRVSGAGQCCFRLSAGVALFVSSVLASQAELVAHLRFDEAGGQTASDSFGAYDAALSPTGANFTAGGVAGNALALNRSQAGFADLGDVLPFTSGSFSISIWFKTVSNDDEVQAVVSRHIPGVGAGYFLMIGQYFGYGQPGHISFFAGSDGVAGSISQARVNDGNWHHVVGVYDSSGMKKIFVDGLPFDSQQNNVGPTMLSQGRLYLGAFSQGTLPRAYFSGSLDEFMIFNHALTDDEVDFLHRNPGVPLGGTSAPVAILPPGGLFTNSVQVVLINNLAGSELRYTLDGTPPLATSPRYTESLTLTQRTEVRAQAFLSGFPISGASTNALFERVYAVNDGVPNAWRFQYFGAGYVTDPRVGAGEDPDGDGSTNYEEYLAGTHPLDPLSGFALTIRLLPELRWEGVANARYLVLRRDSFSGTNFTQIGEVTGTNGVAVFLDEGRPLPEGYYVLRLAP